MYSKIKHNITSLIVSFAVWDWLLHRVSHVVVFLALGLQRLHGRRGRSPLRWPSPSCQRHGRRRWKCRRRWWSSPDGDDVRLLGTFPGAVLGSIQHPDPPAAPRDPRPRGGNGWWRFLTLPDPGQHPLHPATQRELRVTGGDGGYVVVGSRDDDVCRGGDGD